MDIEVAHGHIQVFKKTRYDADYFIIHQNYVRSYRGMNISDHDIALIRLKHSLPLSFEFLPILNFEQIRDGTIAETFTAGGNEHGLFSPYVKSSEIEIRQIFAKPSEEEMKDRFLFYRPTGSETLASGFSGSPIIAYHSNLELFDYRKVLISIQLPTYQIDRKFGRGINLAWYYHWIKHVVYFMDIKVPEKTKSRKQIGRKLYCCKQSTLDEYLIQPYHKRDFANVENWGDGHMFPFPQHQDK